MSEIDREKNQKNILRKTSKNQKFGSIMKITFVIWRHGKPELRKFLIFLNNQHPNIHFTINVEENRKLPFLDILISKKANSILGYQVYRKPTQTDTYMQNRTIIQHKNSLQSIHMYIELSPSLTKNIYR